jgi:hypothetical protein
MARRHQLNDDDADHVEITWTALNVERKNTNEPSFKASTPTKRSTPTKSGLSSPPRTGEEAASQTRIEYDDA